MEVNSDTNSTWLHLENKDSILFLGFSERRSKGNSAPIVFAHYESERFKGDGSETKFKNETLLIASALSLKTKIPDSLVLQVMGQSKKKGFINRQTNWNTAVFFDGLKWKFISEK